MNGARRFVIAAALALAGCSGSSDSGDTIVNTPTQYKIGGTVNGLTGSGLVLQNNGGDDLAVQPGATSFQFAGTLVTGGAYGVTVKTQPTGPAQLCTVAAGSGTVAAQDVTSVAVSCVVVPSHTIGGTVAGLTGTGLVLQNNARDDLAVPAGATTFEFASGLASGATYAVTVRTHPTNPVQSCAVTGGSGTVASSAITSVAVTCVDAIVQAWAAPSAWGARWAPSATMVHHAYFDGSTIVEDPAASSNLTWSVQGGAEPAKRRFDGFPSGPRWGAGPFTGQRYQASGDGDVAALTGDMIVCALFKPDFDPTLDPTTGVGHEKPIIAKGVTDDMATVSGGGWALTQTHNLFMFNYTYKARSDGRSIHAAASVPTFLASQPTGTNGEPETVTWRQNSGPLNPSYVVFCGGRTGNQIYAAVNGVGLDYAPPVPGEPFRHYANDVARVAGDLQPPYTLLDASSNPLTIGGYASGPAKTFGGRIYETAIWAEPGTPANLQAKLAAVQGLNLAGARYVRNREAPFYGPDAVPGTPAAGYHTAWHDGPRIDAQKGFLFGLQAWNRASGYAFADTLAGPLFVSACGEDPGLAPILEVVRPSPPGSPRGDTPGWQAIGGATVAAAGGVEPPGDSERQSAKLVTLPAGGRLVAPLRGFDSAGPVHGQIWLRVPSGTSGTLRIELGYPAAISSYFDVDLAALQAGTWTRIWLFRSPGGPGNELSTAGPASSVSLRAAPGNAAPIGFYAWGLSLTQVGTAVPVDASDPVAGGVRLGAFDLGAEMYDWSAAKDAFNFGNPTIAVDALQLPPVAGSTGATGFCLSFEGTMPANVPWNAPFTAPRTALAWVDDPASPATSARVYLGGATNAPASPGRLCFEVSGAASPLCAAIPASFTAGSKHSVAACMSASGEMRLHVDGGATPLATAAGGVAAPELQGGTLLVGGSSVLPDPARPSHPWHGYISRAAVCRSGGDVGSCR